MSALLGDDTPTSRGCKGYVRGKEVGMSRVTFIFVVASLLIAATFSAVVGSRIRTILDARRHQSPIWQQELER